VRASGWAGFLAGMAVALGACTGGGATGPSTAISVAPRATASQPVASDPVASPPPGASEPAATPTAVPTTRASSPAGAVIVSAENIAFDQADLKAPAKKAFKIEFTNKDDATPHGFTITNMAGKQVFSGDLVVGPATVVYEVPALPAGKYTFACPVHPNMTGRLRVG
jgi:plastocyanin